MQSKETIMQTIVQVEAGCYHTLILTNMGKVYAWGSNENGQLGFYTNNKKCTPCLIEPKFFNHEKIIQISTGSFHSMALTQQGNVYSWGIGHYGQLGHGDKKYQNRPKKIDFKEKKIKMIDTGRRFSFAVDFEDNVYSWGDNFHGQLGLYCEDKKMNPVLVSKKSYNDETIVKVCCGDYHTLLLTTSGNVYACGCNTDGQLGLEMLGDTISNKFQQITKSKNHLNMNDDDVFEGNKIIDIESGNSSFALTQSGKVYSWGNNKHGELGLGDALNRHIPCLIDSKHFKHRRITKINNYLYKSFAITDMGHVYAWGFNKDRDLCMEHKLNVLSPEKIDLQKYFKYEKIKSFSGSFGYHFVNFSCINHSFCVTQSGKLFTWGSNEYGQLGLGHFENIKEPQQCCPHLFGSNNLNNKKMYKNESFNDVLIDFD